MYLLTAVQPKIALNGSFSLDTSVRIEAHDRQGLERLLRYCARPAFAQERLRQLGPEHLVYESKKPGPGGKVSVLLTPHQLLDRHRYYGYSHRTLHTGQR